MLSGPIGNHGVAAMLARKQQRQPDVKSGTKSLYPMVERLLTTLGSSLRCMKNPTRGGLSMALYKVALNTKMGIELLSESIPISDDVQEQCHKLGIEPAEVPNEGVLVAVVSSDKVKQALSVMNRFAESSQAVDIGTVLSEDAEKVFLRTEKKRKLLRMPPKDAFPYPC